MRISVINLALLMSLLAIKPVMADDAVSNSIKSSDFGNMVSSLSNLLSSTNPKPIKYHNIEPAAGDAPIDSPSRIGDLPPLPGQQQHVGVSQEGPIEEPNAIVQPQGNINRLSPQTRRLLEGVPANINNPSHPGGKVSIQRGDFDPEYGKLLAAPIDYAEPTNSAAKQDKIGQAQNQPGDKTKPVIIKPKFDIQMNGHKPNPDAVLITALDEALRALTSGQYESSITLYKDALQKDSHNRDAMFGLAVSYQKARQRPQARRAYARLLSAYPAYQPGLNNLLVLAGDEAPQDALKEMDEISTRNPDFAPVYAQKGVIYMKIGDNEDAKENLIKALNIEPHNITYRYDLAILLDKMGDPINAAKLYVQVLDENTRGSKLPVERGKIEERLTYIGSLHTARVN